MKKSLTTLVITLLSALQLQAQQCEVKFNLNYNTSQQVEPISVKQGCALPLDKKPLPQREAIALADGTLRPIASLPTNSCLARWWA